MRSIYKYPFALANRVSIELPKGAKILSFQSQGEQLCIWALVDASAEDEKRNFRIFGTGTIFDISHYEYIGTAQQMDGALVWHLFEVKE